MDRIIFEQWCAGTKFTVPSLKQQASVRRHSAYSLHNQTDPPVGKLFEIYLRLQHECPYNDLTRKYPEARISQWCNGAADILEIEANGLETFEQLQKELNFVSKSKSSRIISKTLCQDKFQLVARTCYCGAYGTSANPIIAKHNFMEVPPTVLMGGWEHYRLVGFDDSDLKGLLKDLDRIGTTEVLRKKPLSENVTDDNFLLSLSSLFGQLTEKQLKALVTAIENGYYEIPKKVTADELARKQRQPRSTLEEHIRKAESKVLMAMAPYMMMYAGVPGSPFNTTKAAGATVGARIMKELAVQVASKNRRS